jgi:glutathione S-transferase
MRRKFEPLPQPLVLYDISSPHTPSSYAPNPSKARLALLFKRLYFRIEWTDILSIPEVRQSLGCRAGRKFDDGSDFYTLPILRNPNTGIVVGDSFDIALYLDKYWSGRDPLFPENSTHNGLDYQTPYKDTAFYAPLTDLAGREQAAYARFNAEVDTTFSSNLRLFAYNLPTNPETDAEVKALFAKRAHLPSWEVLKVTDTDARKKGMQEFEGGVRTLAECYLRNGGKGVFLEGEMATYADLIVGGWLNMFSKIMPKAEWEEFIQFHGGVFGKLFDALIKGQWTKQGPAASEPRVPT